MLASEYRPIMNISSNAAKRMILIAGVFLIYIEITLRKRQMIYCGFRGLVMLLKSINNMYRKHKLFTCLSECKRERENGLVE